MPLLLDADKDTIKLTDQIDPEPTIRSIIERYYREAFNPDEAKELADELIHKHDTSLRARLNP